VISSRETNESASKPRASIAIEARGVSRRFGAKVALDDVSLAVARGEIHAFLGPNGAGKTTLLRVLTGLLGASTGSVRVLGIDPGASPRALRQVVGLVPSGDRSFYLRLSGLENLAFFARLYGLNRRAALARAREALDDVGLAESASVRVGVYSHGMQKRLSVARALLMQPALLFVDEATHDLDPEGAHRVRELVQASARGGTTVVWTTQRIEEIRGFVDNVTLLNRGTIRFSGSVPALMAHARPQRFVLRVLQPDGKPADLTAALSEALSGLAAIERASREELENYTLSLNADTTLGDALASLHEKQFEIISCREERSSIEEAFLSLTKGDAE
jgi:ABC-2 type transport system ATP-binding protein